MQRQVKNVPFYFIPNWILNYVMDVDTKTNISRQLINCIFTPLTVWHLNVNAVIHVSVNVRDFRWVQSQADLP